MTNPKNNGGAGFVFLLALTCSAQQWPVTSGDPGGSRYSPLKSINRTNVTHLKVAWTYHTGDVSDGKTLTSRSAFEATALVVDGVMYITTPFSRLVALDPETGRELWAFDPKLDRERAYNLFINRGAAYWSDGKKKRVFLGTLDGRLFSIDAATGKQDDSFGNAGWLDLRKGSADKFPGRGYGMTSPPAIYKNLVICGNLTADGEPQGPFGDVRAFDAQTGKQVWIFHTVAQKGEYGNDTWEGDSWKDRAAVNPWSLLSVDVERGIVFLPLTSPATDFYGGDRKGAGLFGDSLVALDAATGKRLWHFQTVHHDLWDYDLPAQPNLVMVRNIPAVAQITKTGLTFIFDRVTGKPLYDIKEVPVPPSEIPGEQAWPTQPVPVAPPPFARRGMRPDELSNVTPESHAFCEKLVEGAVFAEPFTPIGFKPPKLFHAMFAAAHAAGDLGQTQLLHVMQDDHLPVIFGQPLQRIGQEDGLFAAGGLLAGRALGRHQAPIQDVRGLIKLPGQRPLQPHIAAPRSQIATDQFAESRCQNLSQPLDQLSLAHPPKLHPIAVRFQERLLYQVSGIDLTLEPPANLQPSQERQIAAIQLQ